MKEDPRNSVTQKAPGHPENVGKSGRHGEDVIKKDGREPGRYEVEEQGADRPVGKSTLRDQTSVNPKKTIS